VRERSRITREERRRETHEKNEEADSDGRDGGGKEGRDERSKYVGTSESRSLRGEEGEKRVPRQSASTPAHFPRPHRPDSARGGKSSEELSPNKWMIHKSSPIRRDTLAPLAEMRNFVSVYTLLGQSDQ